MKRHLRILLIIVIISNTLFAQNNKTILSKDAEISIFTCSPGEELYSTFGHSAIRVKDAANGFDVVFNYGTFNFNTPHFYTKFVKGNLNYLIATDRFSTFMEEYRAENRSVHEQVLNLSQNQKQKIYDFLVWNIQPENRYYKYDFFFDNCATRVRDVIENNLKDSLIWDRTFESKEMTFRDLLNKYIYNRPWIQFGIHTLIGLPSDQITTTEESMYLPDFMEDAIARSSVVTQNGTQPLVKQYNIIFEAPKKNNEVSGVKPFIFFWLLLLALIIVTFFELRRKKLFAVIDFTVFFSLGLIGFLVFFMWFFSEHKAMVTNLNILWAIPSHVVLAFFVFKESVRKWVKYYFFINSMVYIVFVGVFFILPQNLPLATIPIALIAALRSYNIYRVKKLKD